MKVLISINFILSFGLGYFVYENYKKAQSVKPEIELVKKTTQRAEKNNDDTTKLLIELKARLQKLDKNVNGHAIGDSLRNHIGALQSDVEAIMKKLK